MFKVFAQMGIADGDEGFFCVAEFSTYWEAHDCWFMLNAAEGIPAVILDSNGDQVL